MYSSTFRESKKTELMGVVWIFTGERERRRERGGGGGEARLKNVGGLETASFCAAHNWNSFRSALEGSLPFHMALITCLKLQQAFLTSALRTRFWRSPNCRLLSRLTELTPAADVRVQVHFDYGHRNDS